MRLAFASVGVSVIVVLVACGGAGRDAEPTTTSSSASLPASTTTPPTTMSVPTTTIAVTTTSPTTTTSLSPGKLCDEVVAGSSGLPAGYEEAAFDTFGPLDPAPSMTISFDHGSISNPIGVRATRIEGGVLVSASGSPDIPSDPDDQLPIAAVNHDGSLRWSRCLDANSVVRTAIAAPRYRPANALVVALIANQPEHRYRFVQISLATGAEQTTFAAAMQSIGVDADAVAHLDIADSSDRYALLADNVAVLGGSYESLVRYDLVADVAIDIGVPDELVHPASAPCSGGPPLSLSASGDVVVSNITTDVVSTSIDSVGFGTVAAVWHDGTWSRQPSVLADAVGVRPGFGCGDNLADRALTGVDALGEVRWTDPDLTHPGADDIGWYLDDDVAIGQVCARRVGDECDRYELVGLDPTSGDVRWRQPGIRLVAGSPADGYALVWAEIVGDTLEPPGWVLLDDRAGAEVPGQIWNDPEVFTLHPSREVAGFNRTVRAGGLVLVVRNAQVDVWYPQGAGGETRSVRLP